MTAPAVEARAGNWMQTFTGKAYWPWDPRPEEVDIIDIAHHLSMIVRYTGAVRQFYCVAEHSVHVSYLVPRQHALYGLLHDAPEAYINDLNRPIKHGPEMGPYRRLERINWRVIAPKFGLTVVPPPEIKIADDGICLIEKRALLRPSPLSHGWPEVELPNASSVQIQGYLPFLAEQLFMRRYYELTDGRQ